MNNNEIEEEYLHSLKWIKDQEFTISSNDCCESCSVFNLKISNEQQYYETNVDYDGEIFLFLSKNYSGNNFIQVIGPLKDCIKLIHDNGGRIKFDTDTITMVDIINEYKSLVADGYEDSREVFRGAT